MPESKEEARRKCLAALPRPTVADRMAADRIVSESLAGVALAAGLLGLSALCGLLYQGVVL